MYESGSPFGIVKVRLKRSVDIFRKKWTDFQGSDRPTGKCKRRKIKTFFSFCVWRVNFQYIENVPFFIWEATSVNLGNNSVIRNIQLHSKSCFCSNRPREIME